MRANSNMNVTCTLNKEDLLTLYEDGELEEDGVSIMIPSPEAEMFKEMITDEDRNC